MTTSAGVNLHLNLPLLQTRAIVNTYKPLPTLLNTIKINEYSRNPSGVLSNTIFDYFGLLITSNARWDSFTSLSIRNFSIRKGWGCSSEILNQTPKGDRSGRGLSFFPTPKRDHVKTQAIYIFLYFSRATLNETFTAKYDGVLPRMSRQKKKKKLGRIEWFTRSKLIVLVCLRTAVVLFAFSSMALLVDIEFRVRSSSSSAYMIAPKPDPVLLESKCMKFWWQSQFFYNISSQWHGLTRQILEGTWNSSQKMQVPMKGEGGCAVWSVYLNFL